MTLFLSPSSAQPAFRQHGCCPPASLQSVTVCLTILESRHGEWPGESLNAVAQISHASNCLRVLNKEVPEVLELSWKRQHTREPLFYCSCSRQAVRLVVHRYENQVVKIKWEKEVQTSGCSEMHFRSQHRLTGFLLNIQRNLKALVHQLNNMHKVCFFELPGGQSRSTWQREKHKINAALNTKRQSVLAGFFLYIKKKQ